jgi:hypothetical protein
MDLDRSELQLLLSATRDAAWTARAREDGLPDRSLATVFRANAAALERLASRLETELVRPPPPEA